MGEGFILLTRVYGFMRVSHLWGCLTRKEFLPLLMIMGKYFGGHRLLIPLLCAVNMSFLPYSNLNFGVSPPWLEKNLKLAPLKCIEMLPNRSFLWKLSD